MRQSIRFALSHGGQSPSAGARFVGVHRASTAPRRRSSQTG